MTRIYETLSTPEKIYHLEQALDFIGAMVAGNVDGEKYLGPYVTVEAELRDLRSQGDTKDRIRQRLAERSIQFAA